MKLSVPLPQSYSVGDRKIKKLSLHFLFARKVGHPYHIGENLERGIKFLSGGYGEPTRLEMESIQDLL